MGQADIAEILENRYPEWLSFHDIVKILDISTVSIQRSLKALSRREEIECEVVIIPKSKRRRITYYRIRK